MKICPICKKSFADELNFCLDDGGLLVESESYNTEQTLAFSQKPTLQFPNRTTNDSEVVTQIQNKARQNFPPRYKPQPNLWLRFGILFSVGFLILLAMVGSYFLLRPTRGRIEDPPDIYLRTPSPTPIKTPTPTPKVENYVKVDVLEKVTDGSGKKFLKCNVTNISEKVIETSFIGLSFYKGDVKIRDSGADLKLKVLKPNQTMPIWVNLYGTDGYTSVKAKEPTFARPLTKPIEQIFPSVELSQTEMKAEAGYMSVNFRQYRTTYYKVSGVVENQRDETISTEIAAIFYNEKSEIVGFGRTSSLNLPKGEKTKFEIQQVEADLFGKPKTFELIAISAR